MGASSLKDVAREAGVSISTASRVLNKADTPVAISDATKARVLEVARRVGYVPSAAARALRRGSTRTIGVLSDSPADFLRAVGQGAFDAEMMRGLMTAALRERLHLLLLTGISEENGAYNSRVAELGMADGLLVLNRDLARGGAAIEAISRLSKPVVYLLDYPDGDGAHVCAPDDAQGGRLAAEKLLAAGHRRIGFLIEPDYYAGVFGRRRAGWEAALRAAGISPEPAWTVSLASADRKTFSEQGLTALVSPNDGMAQTFRSRVAPELGLSVPGDVSIVTFAYDIAATDKPPALASVTTPLAPIVSRGVSMLGALIGGTAVAERRFAPEFTFVPGRSMAARRA